MIARVVAFNAISADGFTEGFSADESRFYELAADEPEDVTLAGSNTILSAQGAELDREDGAPPPLRGGASPCCDR